MVWALVVTDSADRESIGQVVVAFASPREADEFARRHELEGRVTELRFAVQMDQERTRAALPVGGRR